MPLALTSLGAVSEALGHDPLLAAGLLFLAGLATSLTPCVYPLIPITAALVGGADRAAAGRGRAIALTLSYVAGVALLYALMGLAAGLSGSLFGAVAANRWVLLGMGNLLVVFALALADVLPVAAPQRLARWAAGLGGGSYPAAFLLGATSGIVAAPCGAPAFAAVLTWVTTTQSAGLGFLYLLVFSLGMTAVLIAVGVSAGAARRLPRPGPWMVWVKRAAAVLLLAMAEYYFIQAGKVW